MSSANTGDSPVPDQLVDQLVRGYDALALEITRVQDQQRELENKLSWAKQQYLDALKRFTPISAAKDFHEFLAELDEAAACEKEGGMSWLSQLAKSGNEDQKARAFDIQTAETAREKLSYRRRSTDINEVRIWAGRSADPVELESDFTTAGTPGRLGCPFTAGRTLAPQTAAHARGVSTPRSSLSKLSFGRRSRKASFHDPIKAEECFSIPMSPERSLAGSMPLCPIRFLDQHSPEEVARYFENHKHEVPRSHEFCIKRFQGDEEVIRKMDSKYANLVTMVKDLGNVHKPMLPDTEDIDVDAEEDGEEEIVHTSVSKVAKWAETIEPSRSVSEQPVTVEDEDRESRFERSLKDVRVGESPSRPWGINVPVELDACEDGRPARSDATASPAGRTRMATSAAPMRCPFSGMNASQIVNPDDIPHPLPPIATISREPSLASLATHSEIPVKLASEPHSPQVQSQTEPRSVPQYVFNGPVFFGNFSMEQAMSAMKRAGLNT